MLCWIGQRVLLDGRTEVHVQDVDRLEMTAKVGVPDCNGIIWDAQWVDTARLGRESIQMATGVERNQA